MKSLATGFIALLCLPLLPLGWIAQIACTAFMAGWYMAEDYGNSVAEKMEKKRA